MAQPSTAEKRILDINKKLIIEVTELMKIFASIIIKS